MLRVEQFSMHDALLLALRVRAVYDEAEDLGVVDEIFEHLSEIFGEDVPNAFRPILTWEQSLPHTVVVARTRLLASSRSSSSFAA